MSVGMAHSIGMGGSGQARQAERQRGPGKLSCLDDCFNVVCHIMLCHGINMHRFFLTDVLMKVKKPQTIIRLDIPLCYNCVLNNS